MIDPQAYELLRRAVDTGGDLAEFFNDYSPAERGALQAMTRSEPNLFVESTPGVFRITERGRRVLQTQL